ncbi:hypothetical protein ANN_06836 [Periplaneta americana]|uniref:RNase H type-1 domain-containing protein n=1 Tax=Periplaneta americana TaxID=6978 RepID=A0ABQ8TH13_PERAM|nr:hypothetical protein ANN_06836 [Periplaneta americana]
MFENKVLRKIFGAKRDEVTGEWRKLRNAELHALYSSPDIIKNVKYRRLRWAWHIARIGESINAYRIKPTKVTQHKTARIVFFTIRNIKSRCLRWAGYVASVGESRIAYRVLVRRPEGKRPLGRPRRRWEDNIKVDLREVGYDDRDWIGLAQDRDLWRAYVRAAMNLWTTQELFHTLLTSDYEIGVVWTPGHVGIPGNEAADAAARDGAMNGSEVYWRERWQDIQNYLKYTLWCQWEGEWSPQEGNKLRRIKNTVRVWDSSTRESRHEEVLLTRLRIGHCHLTWPSPTWRASAGV